MSVIILNVTRDFTAMSVVILNMTRDFTAMSVIILNVTRDFTAMSVIVLNVTRDFTAMSVIILIVTGELVVVQRPDYESSPEIRLTAMAKNWGSVQGNDTDTCDIIITVEDANDPPVFEQDEYTAHVAEESLRDTPVITVTASDNDLRPENRVFEYRIAAGNEGSRFRIDSRTGRIVTTGIGVLDRETVPSYRLTVWAVDTGQPPEIGQWIYWYR